jgi:hypothetical protein
MNVGLILMYLLEAVRHAQRACERTRQMVVVALARLQALLAIQRAART